MEAVSLVPLIKLAVVFGLVILLLRLSVQLGLALALGAVTLGLLFAMSPADVLKSGASALVDEKTIALSLIISLILILSHSMERFGHLDQLLLSVRKSVGTSPFGFVVFPALIGLLPMPGGAVFSAPMLGAFDRENRTSPELKSFLNYWFRHIWEYWWPLYPGILLLCSMAGLSLWHYMFFSWPITLIAIAGGLPRLLGVPRSGPDRIMEREPLDGAGNWRAIWPFGLAILPGVVLTLVDQLFGILPGNPGLAQEAGFVGGLVAAVVWTWRVSRVRASEVLEILLDPRLVRMWITVAGVFVFKGLIEQCGAAEDLGKALVHLAVPLEGVVVLLPLVVGGLIGLTVAYVGTTFPILVPLIQEAAPPEFLIPLMILAFVSGFIGVLLSPLHLCLILSNEHFGASWLGVYRYLIVPCITLFGGSVVYVWILKAALG